MGGLPAFGGRAGAADIAGDAPELAVERRRSSYSPLLLSPAIGQRAGELCEGEIGRRGAVEECRHDPGRDEGERCQQPDVPLDLSFPPGDHGEAGGAAMRQIVDPLAGLGDRDQERLAAASSDRRVVRGHMDDALDGGRTGLVQGTAIVVTLAVARPAEVFAGLWACAGSLIWRSRSSRWFGVNVTRSRWRSRRSRSLSGNCSPALLALR